MLGFFSAIFVADTKITFAYNFIAPLTYLFPTQQTFQRRFNVVFGLIWRRDVAQRQINVETTLRTSTLKSTTFNNVETTLCISMLNWTTLDNVETTLSFSTSIFTMLGNVETTLQIWPFEKKYKPPFKNKMIFLNFKEYVGLNIFLHLFPILTVHDGGCYHIEASPLICGANQWTGFYIIAASVMKG